MNRRFCACSDEALCRLAAQGDAQAEEALILRYTRTVRACARPLFLAGGDSEDLTQEGMLGLLDAIRRFDPRRDASFHTYAEVCIRNRLRSAARAAGREKHQPLNSSLSLELSQLEEEDPTAGPEETLIHREMWEEWRAGLAQRLSSFERDVLTLYLSGLSYEDIGEKLRRSAKSVDNAVQRIRRKLERPKLGDFSES